MISTYSRYTYHKRLQFPTINLWNNLVSPFGGIVSCVFNYLRQTYDPRAIAFGAQLADVATFRGIQGPITYHIGGMSINRDDAMIKCLAESYERYISVIHDPEKTMPHEFTSYEKLIHKYPGDLIPDTTLFKFYLDSQYAQEGFFKPFSNTENYCWVKAPLLTRQQNIWLPAQLLFLGYLIKKDQNEFRINNSVSTGTAVHITRKKALINSFLEMILLDAVVGHWYCKHPAYKILFDARTKSLERIINKSIPHKNIHVEFYWIPNLEFSTFNVACVAHGQDIPKFTIGLGADVTLEGAMYKAYLEWVGTRFLSNTLSILTDKEVVSETINNFDDNVYQYAHGHHSDRIHERFSSRNYLKASELQQDLSSVDENQVIQQFISQAQKNHIDVAFLDLTYPETRQLNLFANKVWSPQLIGLPLPMAVPVAHPRLSAYGGAYHLDPHPYP